MGGNGFDRTLRLALTMVIVTLAISKVGFAQDDFSGPIKCFYCFGPAENSSCADPVHPREDKDKTLHVIECEHGICLKWTHYWNNQLYMHRTCSAKLPSFRIMMIDGVCRSERTGNGYLCMCGKHLCNHGNELRMSTALVVLTTITTFITILHHTSSSWR